MRTRTHRRGKRLPTEQSLNRAPCRPRSQDPENTNTTKILNLDYSSSRTKLDFGHYAKSNTWCYSGSGLLRESHSSLDICCKYYCSYIYIQTALLLGIHYSLLHSLRGEMRQRVNQGNNHLLQKGVKGILHRVTAKCWLGCDSQKKLFWSRKNHTLPSKGRLSQKEILGED